MSTKTNKRFLKVFIVLCVISHSLTVKNETTESNKTVSAGQHAIKKPKSDKSEDSEMQHGKIEARLAFMDSPINNVGSL